MSKHTPGPWAYWSGYNPYDKIEAQVTAEGGDIVIASYNHLIAEGEANAALIAAAPDLLEALERCAVLLRIKRHACEDSGVCRILDSHISQARSAIAKAKGEQP